MVIVPLLVTEFGEFSVTATGPATFTVAPEPMIRLSGLPLLAVAVLTGLVVEPTVVSARARPGRSSNNGAAAAAESNNIRMRAAPPTPIAETPVYRLAASAARLGPEA